MATNSNIFSKWNVECLDGTHGITVERNTSGQVYFNLYVDTQLIQTITPTRKGLVICFEHNFECGGETLTLVLHGPKLDLVHRGILQNSKIKFEPENVLPASFRAVLLVLNFLSMLSYVGLNFIASPSSIIFFLLSVTMVLSVSVLILSYSTSPFYSKKKKIAYCVCCLLLCISIVVAFSRMGDLIGALLF